MKGINMKGSIPATQLRACVYVTQLVPASVCVRARAREGVRVCRLARLQQDQYDK